MALTVMAAARAQIPDGYYDTVNASYPADLRSSLHVIIDDHTRFPYTSAETDTWDILEMADQDMQDESRIVTVYRNSSFAKVGGGNNLYNREHTWPRSYGFPDNDDLLNYPFTDMHHLFLAHADYNFFRSNKPFEDCDASCVEYITDTNNGRGGAGGAYPGDSNWTIGEFTSGKWEVWQHRKGDIARAMMYMDLRYEGGTHGVTSASEPDLILTDDRNLIDGARTGSNESIAYMGILSTLLQWHLQDPVDATEIQHHEMVAAAQGNRNPFIDNPDWAACVFEGICFVINAGLNDAWVSTGAAFQGMFITVFPDLKIIFLAWFTFDSSLPGGDVSAQFGAVDQRWVTAVGSYSGAKAVLKAELTSGGKFNASEPLPTQQQDYGSIVLEFADCTEATVSYEFPGPGLSGSMTINRVVDSNVALCQLLNAE